MNYKVVRTETADARIRKIILYVAENFGMEVALEKLEELERNLLDLGKYPQKCVELRYLVLKRQGYKVLVLEKNLVFYKINEEKQEAIIYAGEGQSFYPRYYNGKFALHQRCYAITDFASCILPKYCYHFMNTLNSYFVRNSVGSTVPSLRMDIFQKAEIKLPPISKQQHICKIIDVLCSKLEVEQSVISSIQELKQFLLSQMFI